MEFESMVVYRTWMETFDDLDNETVGEVIKMMMHYGMDGEDISDQMSPAARAIFKMSKGNIDANKQKRTSGAKGGKAKGKQTESKPKANNKQTASKSQADEKQTATNENDNENENVNENIIKTSSSPRSATDARFDIFWQTYPNKVGKENARKAWSKIKPDAELFDKIIKKIEELKVCDDWTKNGGQYVPHPATWLNRGGWDDEIPKSRSPGRKNSFQNFTGRTRTQKDYEDIERGLLGVRRRA